MLNFLKKIFSQREEKETTLSSLFADNKTVQVPESVLDRFILNCNEFRYYHPSTGALVFIMQGKNAKIGKDPMTAGITVMSLLWLRKLYDKNRPLFSSIINRFADKTNIPDDDMRKFLHSRFNTGLATKQPQLSTFYERGSGIVRFMDALIPYAKFVFDDEFISKQDSFANNFQNDTTLVNSAERISIEDFAKIIVRDLRVNNEDGKPQNSQELNYLDELSEVKHVRPKMPRQTKRQKSSRIDSPTGSNAFLLLFSATWCGPSKRFKREIEAAGINFYTLIDVDQEKNESLVDKYSICNVPTTILVSENGEIINKWIGYDDEDPGQSKFVNYIKNCNYNILPFMGTFS